MLWWEVDCTDIFHQTSTPMFRYCIKVKYSVTPFANDQNLLMLVSIAFKKFTEH